MEIQAIQNRKHRLCRKVGDIIKNLIRAFGIIIVMLIMTATSIVIYTKDTKKAELTTAVTEGVEETLNTIRDTNSKPETEAEAADLLVANITKRLNSSNTLNVNIYSIDMDNGLIDVEATLDYYMVFGKSKTTVRKTMILDSVPADLDKETIK